MFSLFLFWFCTDERFWNFCSLCYGIFYLFLAVVLGFKDRVIQKNNLHVCHKKGTKLEERNSFTNFFLINQLCLSTGIKKNPICEKDCMKIKLSVMSCSCMAIAYDDIIECSSWWLWIGYFLWVYTPCCHVSSASSSSLSLSQSFILAPIIKSSLRALHFSSFLISICNYFLANNEICH